MTCRQSLIAVVSVCLVAAAVRLAAAQAAPDLTHDQRALLSSLLAAVDEAQAARDTPDGPWQLHVLRASDGSHYVALSVRSTPEAPVPAAPLLVYVRLSTAPAAGVTTAPERSAVREFLAGARTDPRLLPPTGFVVGEMPLMGAGSIVERVQRGETPAGSPDLKVLELKSERARQRRVDEERQRRAALEGAAAPGNALPFEDFDLTAPAALGDGTPVVARALTAGPGSYVLSLAWTEAGAAPGKAAIRLARRRLSLPPVVAGEFGLSSAIVADRVTVRDAPWTAVEQRAHPYAIGLTEITPAADAAFTRDERLSVVFQVVAPTPDAAGKPDVAADFRIVRVEGGREEPAASLSPLRYDASTLPADFDVRLGHPVLAAMSVPLATLRAGAYRLHITATDRLGVAGARASIDFRVSATPLSLLKDAPASARPFRRAAAIEGAALAATVDLLAPTTPSAALARALASARDRRFISLVRDEPVDAAEQPVRVALTGLALFALGDPSAVTQLQRAAQLGAPAGPLALLTGAARALEGRDADAIAAWREALDAGVPPRIVWPLVADASLRRGDAAASLDAARAWREAAPGDGWWRALAAAAIAAGGPAEALPALDARLAAEPSDLDARWLLAHALYALAVAGPADARAGAAARFRDVAGAYVAAGGPHSAMAREWLAALPAQAR